MKKTVVVAAMILASTPALSQGDKDVERNNLLAKLGSEIGNVFTQDADTKAWYPSGSAVVDGKATCAVLIGKLADLGTPGTAKVRIDNDSPELLTGEHSLDDILPVCERVSLFAKTKEFERWAQEALREHNLVVGKKQFNEKYFTNCIEAYDEMRKLGVGPSTKIPERMVMDQDLKPVKFGGTVESVKKQWCDVGLKLAKAEIERRDGPYKKVLKADKLSIGLAWRAVWLAGGKESANPAEMAKANVWFTAASPGLVCLKKGTPEVTELTRYEFDAAHKIVRSSSTKYCGAPPASAYK